jgi:hypothetical protein
MLRLGIPKNSLHPLIICRSLVMKIRMPRFTTGNN